MMGFRITFFEDDDVGFHSFGYQGRCPYVVQEVVVWKTWPEQELNLIYMRQWIVTEVPLSPKKKLYSQYI